MSSASKGRRQEHRCIEKLYKEGYTAHRTAASKGVWDVYGAIRCDRWAEGMPTDRWVQVKSNRWPEGREMRSLTADAANHAVPGRQFEIWVYVDGQRRPRIKLFDVQSRTWGEVV